MTDVEKMLAEHACAKLITEYAALLDAGRWEDVAALYLADGRIVPLDARHVLQQAVQRLAERGWHAAQGWHISHPLAGDQVPAFARCDPGSLAPVTTSEA